MDGEGRRSKEAVRNSIRTYGVKVMDPASMPLKKTKQSESVESVSRFSERSLHSHYEIREGCCKHLLNRIPYATLLATIICLLGVMIVSAAERRAAVLTNAMIHNTLKKDSVWVTAVDVLFLVLEIITGIVAVMIFIIGILATGDTRAKVYKAWQARIGGRLCCAILMVVSLLLFLVWLGIFGIMGILCFISFLSKMQCDLYTGQFERKQCIDLPWLNAFFSSYYEVQICESQEVKKFCKDFVEKVSPSYVMADLGIFLVIFSFVLFLICLAANYARIRCQAKFQELEELRHLEGDLHSSKDRF